MADDDPPRLHDRFRHSCPNEIIRRDSLRFRESFEAHELTHPYQEWVAVSRWEGGLCGYFFMHGPARPPH